MKRILSFLLVLSFALALPMMASAAGEAYDIAYDADEGVLIINNLQADAAGRIVLGLKKSDVTVYSNIGTIKKPKMVEATADNQDGIWADAGYSVAASYFAEDDNYVYVGCDWYDSAAVNTSEDEDDYLFWVTVEFADADALNAESIITVLDQTALEALLPATAGYYGSTLSGISDGVAMPVIITYPNSDVEVGGGNTDAWEAGEDVVTDEFKAALDADVDYVRAVAIFGKNAAGTDYTVTFGANSYAGTAVVGQPWAMVLYDNGTAGRDLISSTAGSYAYTVNAGEATWSGTAAVITK